MKVPRRPRRFFSEQILEGLGQRILIPAAEACHFQKILRLVPGDELLLSDSAGGEARARIESYQADGQAWVRILEAKTAAVPSAGPRICLWAAFAAKGVMDELVEKCQELGVEEFRPVWTERTVVSLSAEKEGKVLDRWYKIIREAAKQSGNTQLMSISAPLRLAQAWDLLNEGEEAIFFHPGTSAAPGWGAWLEQARSKKMQGARWNLFIGPEGGFSEKEIGQARQKAKAKGIGFAQVSLGPHVLRVQTAAVAAIAAAKLKFL